LDIITGDPGAGKTLLAVKLLTDKYFFWHNKDRQFYRSEEGKKYVIFTNIDGFKLPHKNLNDIFKDTPFDVFFTKDFQDRLHSKYPHVVYVIDEAQQYIDKYYRKKEVIFYFDYHRHFGDRVYLITQHFTKICKDISVLHDYEYRAVSRKFSLTGEFRYNVKSKGDKVKTESFRASKRYYDLYTSFSGDIMEKKKNPVLKILVALIISFLLIAYYFFHHQLGPKESLSVKSVPSIATPFRGEIEKKTKVLKMSDIEPPIDQVYSVQITGWAEVKGRLYMFVDPITLKAIMADDALYPVKKFNNSYYAMLTLAQYAELNKVSRYTNSIQNSDNPQVSYSSY
jgi:hypothetical protein